MKILFEVQGKPIQASIDYCWEDENGECIIFF